MSKSKFDFCAMSGDEDTVIVFNKARWTKEDALKQALFELDFVDHYKEEDLIIFESFIEFGFYTNFDHELMNDWHIRDCEQTVKPRHNSVAVWVCRAREDSV